MEQIMNYVKPELLIVAVVLYFIGMGIKKSEVIPDKYIPAILGALGILICGIYVIATCAISGAQEIAMAIFTAITQGILVAGLSNYVKVSSSSCDPAESSEVSFLPPISPPLLLPFRIKNRSFQAPDLLFQIK